MSFDGCGRVIVYFSNEVSGRLQQSDEMIITPADCGRQMENRQPCFKTFVHIFFFFDTTTWRYRILYVLLHILVSILFIYSCYNKFQVHKIYLVHYIKFSLPSNHMIECFHCHSIVLHKAFIEVQSYSSFM